LSSGLSHIQTLAQVSVEVGGAALPAEDCRTLCEVRVRQRLSLPTLCELRFLDPVGGLAEATAVRAGAALRVAVKGHDEPLFVGQVTAVEHVYEPSGGTELRVRGYDRLHQLRKRQPVRAHVGMSLADLMRELAADLGVTVEAAEGGPVWKRLIQHRQSDFDLLVEVAERSGLYFTLRGDVLHVLSLEGVGEYLPLTRGETLFEARIELNGDTACRAVSAIGWDPLRVERHGGRAAAPRTGRGIAAEVSPDSLGGTGERVLVNETVQDDRQAEALAQGELDARAAREATLWGVAEGDPRLRPGTPVLVRGVALPLAGQYVLTAVDHTLDPAKGFVSEITSEPPARRTRERGTLAALGVVTHVEDPDGLGRVQVSLPTYNDVETDWLGVLIAGAGAGKGMLALPDVGDTVLVLFANGDPAQGIVLGGLYGAREQAEWDWGVEAGAVKRYTFLTPGGQRVRLDDARELVRLENSDGSFIEMSPEKVLLHAQRRLEIDAPGQEVVIRGQKIDFERA
jgi:phage protein D/phage baseplate assembly protein gpV